MKFRFPVIIIDEDWRAESSSGLGIRALAKALEELEEQGMEVVGGFTYVDVGMVANQAARASAFVVSIDDEEVNEDGVESQAVHDLRKFIEATRRRNADVPIFLFGETRTSQHLPNDILRELHGFIATFCVKRTSISARWHRHFSRNCWTTPTTVRIRGIAPATRVASRS